MARGALITAADVGRCPHRVALDRGSPVPIVLPPTSTEVARRIREASDHRARVIESIRNAHPSAVVAGNPASTRSAMALGSELILQARLVDDGVGQRSCSVDVLVRTGREDDRHRYAPVVIKNNEITDAARTRRMLEGSIANPLPSAAEWTGGVGVRRNDTMTRNGLALAHATRVLEALGHEDAEHFGGLIDRHDRLWWFDMDNADWGRWRLSSYDDAYRQRLEIIRGHDRWQRGEGPFPTSPFWHRECLTCPYNAQCESELETIDDVSLVHFTSWDQQALLHEHGISTRVQLAGLDPLVARMSRRAAFSLNAEHLREEHLGRSLDKLDDLIYRARAIVRSTPLLIGSPRDVHCPVADVEIDIDMESYNDVTYLWGASVTTRRPVAGLCEGYISFVSWDTLSTKVEADVFAEFWKWFTNAQQLAHNSGATFAAYCFWAQAEESAMNRAVTHGGDGVPSMEELDLFRRGTPGEWIDLHEVSKRLIQTEGPLGLKSLARSAGFSWRDDNPSGEASMTWYEAAVGPVATDSVAARRRLLEYNEDDCRATRALREWINSGAQTLPSRDEWPPKSR